MEKKLKNKKIIIVGMTAIVILAGVGFGFYNYVAAGKPPKTDQTEIEKQRQALLEASQNKDLQAIETFDPEANKLHIPKLDLMEKIYVTEDSNDVDLGVWLEKDGSHPNQGSNTILTAHRWGRESKNPFYYLDKLKAGDEINVYWQNQLYHYEVEGSKVVLPDAMEILEPTSDSILTLYTCTPLFSDAKRLVVTAKLQQVEMLAEL